MTIALTSAQNRFLRGQAHQLKILLQTGDKGLTSAFLSELNDLLERHELIMVKVVNEDREMRDMLIATLTAQSGSVLVQRIGHIAIL
ncbi:YhbY family RNA-binding protein, partial [Xylella fastidiosa subsp. multiplex]|uniref:YhbY family RNA-binding protein n=1 Tax=Xylella fastidiosa TaxID=2371 RepID=UPI0020C44D42